MNDELKPCPFCGGEAGVEALGDWGWRLTGKHRRKCILREVVIDAVQWRDEREALIKEWNRRVVPTQVKNR